MDYTVGIPDSNTINNQVLHLQGIGKDVPLPQGEHGNFIWEYLKALVYYWFQRVESVDDQTLRVAQEQRLYDTLQKAIDVMDVRRTLEPGKPYWNELYQQEMTCFVPSTLENWLQEYQGRYQGHIRELENIIHKEAKDLYDKSEWLLVNNDKLGGYAQKRYDTDRQTLQDVKGRACHYFFETLSPQKFGRG